MKRTKAIFLNFTLVVFSVALCLVLMELLVFRFILVAPDFPKLAFENDVLRYTPNQSGVFRVKNEIQARFRINGDGWNSKYDHYETSRSDNKFRVAVVGDSKVEAFHVNYDESLAEQIEQADSNDRLEVYRFAISGAPLSQYLQILRKDIIKYSPDLVVVILVHNDFDESYLPTPGVYTKSFLKIDVSNDTVQGEVLPVEYQTPWYGYIRNSATWRYLAYRQKFSFSTLRNLIFRREKLDQSGYRTDMEKSGSDIKMARNKLVTKYIFQQMKELCMDKDAQLLIVMEGDRDAAYGNGFRGQSAPKSGLSLNTMAESVAKEYGIDFIDLQPVFQKDFRTNQKDFYFSSDAHWNKHGHGVVAKVIADFINSRLPSQSAQ